MAIRESNPTPIGVDHIRWSQTVGFTAPRPARSAGAIQVGALRAHPKACLQCKILFGKSSRVATLDPSASLRSAWDDGLIIV